MPLRANGWNPTVITRAISKYETATRTVRVDTDQGEGFLKALGNPEGPHALACELVGSLAADWIGLTTFDFSLIEVTDRNEVVIDGRSCADVGPAFISRAENSCFTWGGDSKTIASVSNPDDISKLVIIDTWLRNCDRYSPDGRRINLGNVFLLQKTFPQRRLELLAMDFTHSFTCGQPLDRRLGQIDRIQDARIYGLFPEFKSLLSPTVVSACAQLLATFTAADAEMMVSKVPRIWLSDGVARGNWKRYLTDRAHFLAKNVESIVWPVNPEFEYPGEPCDLN